MTLFKTAAQLSLLIVLLTGCYELESVSSTSQYDMRNIPANQIVKGEDYTPGSPRRSMLLAGNRAYPGGVPDFSIVDINQGTNIDTNFTISGVSSAFDFSQYGHGFMHIDTLDGSHKLNLFFIDGSSLISSTFLQARLVKPELSYTLSEGSRRFRFTQICGLASPSQNFGWVLPGMDEHHLLMSVKACDVDNPNYCIGGVIDAWFEPNSLGGARTWRIHSDQRGYYAAVRKPNNGYFSDECMPIESTRGHNPGTSDQAQHTLAVLDPSMNEISLYSSEDLIQGRLASLSAPSGQRILDFSIEAYNNRGETSDSATLVVLYQQGSSKILSHYAIVNSQFFATPFLTETVRQDAHHIVAEVGSRESGNVYVIGTNGTSRRQYRKAD